MRLLTGPWRSSLILAAVALGLGLTVGGCTGEPSRDATPEAGATRDPQTDVYNCMLRKGWEVVRIEFGGVGAPPDLPASQFAVYDEDLRACVAEYSPGTPPPLTAEQANANYDAAVAAAECLRGRGYVISDPPSRQAYVDEVVGGYFASWDPFHELIQLEKSRDKFQEAANACQPK